MNKDLSFFDVIILTVTVIGLLLFTFGNRSSKLVKEANENCETIQKEIILFFDEASSTIRQADYSGFEKVDDNYTFNYNNEKVTVGEKYFHVFIVEYKQCPQKYYCDAFSHQTATFEFVMLQEEYLNANEDVTNLISLENVHKKVDYGGGYLARRWENQIEIYSVTDNVSSRYVHKGGYKEFAIEIPLECRYTSSEKREVNEMGVYIDKILYFCIRLAILFIFIVTALYLIIANNKNK